MTSNLQGIFSSEFERASEMYRQGRPRYWLAYCRGLRRGFGGSSEVPDAEHRRWLGLHPALHEEEIAGYRDALAFAAGASTTADAATCEAPRAAV